MSEVVDTKVVELKFDNKKFEENIQKTLNSIDDLKEKLDFKTSTKSLKEVEKEANNISFDKVASSVESIEKRFSILGIAGKRAIENITDSVIGLSKQTYAFLKNGIINGGITRAMNLENAHFQLQGLLKDEKAVDAVMKNVNDSVDGTAYSLDSAAKVASQLAASGMRAGDKMFTSLRAVAGVAAMTNSEYDSIGQIFTTVAGNGRLMGDQLLQLSTRGLNAAATLAEYLKKTGKKANATEADVREMVSEGKIDFATFAAAMDDAFGEHAKKANSTFTGAMANVKASLARIGADFVSPLVEQNSVLVKTFNTLRERINEVKTYITPVSKLFVDAVTRMGRAANKFLKNVDIKQWLNKFKGLYSPWERLSNRITEAGVTSESFEKTMTKVAKSNDFNLGKMIKKEGSLNDVIEKGKVPKKILIQTLKEYTDVSKKSSKETKEVAKNVKKLVKNAKDANMPLSDIVDRLGKPSGRALLIDSFANAFKGLRKILKQIKKLAWREIFPKSTADDVYKIIKSIHKFSEQLIITDDTADKLRRTFKGVWAVLDIAKTLISNLIKSVFGPLSSALGSTSGTILDMTASFGDSIVALDEWIKEGHGLDFIFQAISDGVGSISKIISAVIDKIHEWITAVKPFDIIEETITKLVTGIGNLLKGFSGFSNLGKNGVTKFVDLIKKFNLDGINLENIKKIFTNFADVVQRSMTKAGNAIHDFVPRAASGFSNFGKAASNGLQTFGKKFSEVFTTVKGFITGHVGEILTVGVGVGFIVSLKKLSKSIEAIVNATKPLKGAAIGVLNKLSATIKTYQRNIRSEVLMNVAKSIAVLVASVVLLGSLNSGELKSGLAALALVSALMVAMGKAMDSVTAHGDSKGLLGIAAIIFGISGAMWTMTKSLKQMADLDYKRMWSDMAVLGTISLTLVGMVKVVSKSAANLKKGVVPFFSMMVALRMLIGVFKSLDKLKINDPGKVIKAMIGVVGAFSLLIASTKLAGKNTSQAGKSMLGMSAALFVMIGVIKGFNKFKPSELDHSMEAITKLLGVFSIMMVLSKFAGQYAGKAGVMILAMTGSLVVLTGIIFLLKHMTPDGLDTAVETISKLILVFSVLVAASHLAKDCKGTVITMGTVISGLGLLMSLLSIVNQENLRGASQSLSLVMTTLAGVIAATSLIGKSGQKMGKALGALALMMSMVAGLGIVISAIGLMAADKGSMKNIIDVSTSVSELLLAMSASLVILTKVGDLSSDVNKGLFSLTVVVSALSALMAGLGNITVGHSLETATSVSELLLAMSASLVILSKVNSLASGVESGMKTLTLVVLGLSGALAILQLFNVSSVVEKAAGLSTLLLALSASMIIISKLTDISENTKSGLFTLTLVVAGLAGALAILQLFDVSSAMEKAAGLSTLLLSLSASLLLVSEVKNISPMALAGLGVMVIVVGLLATIIGVLAHFNVGPTLEIAKSLSLLLISMSGSMVLLGVAGLMGPSALAGAVSLILVIGALGAVGVAIGAFMKEHPRIKEFLDTGIPIMEQLCNALGSLFGNVIAGFVESVSTGLMDSLGNIGTGLSNFMANAQGFINGANAINPESMKGVKTLAETMAILVGTDFIDGIKNFLHIGQKGNPLENFSKQLPILGHGLVDFSNSVEGFNPDTALPAIKALSKLAKAAKDIPNSGGFWGDLWGENDFSTFGQGLGQLGEKLAIFSQQSAGIDIESFNKGADALKAIATAANEIPNEEGVLAWWIGDNKLSTFGAQLPNFGIGLMGFARNVAGFDDSMLQSALLAAQATEAIATMADKLPNEGGALAWWIGDNSLGTYADELPGFGDALANFSIACGNVSVDNMNVGVAAGEALANMIKALPKSGNKIKEFFSGKIDMDAFGSSVSKMADIMVDFSTKLKDFKTKKAAVVIPQLNDIINIVKGLSSADESVPSGFGDGLESIANAGIDKFLNAFKSSGEDIKSTIRTYIIDSASLTLNGGYQSFNDAGRWVIAGFISGMKGKYPDVLEAAANIGNGAVDALNIATQVESPSKLTRETGYYMAEGLAAGLKDGTKNAVKSAVQIGTATEKSLRDVLGVHSPSKKAKAIGMFFAAGLAKGIDNGKKGAGKSSEGLGNTIIEKFSSNKGVKKVLKGFKKNGFSEGVKKGIKKFAKKFENDKTMTKLLNTDDAKKSIDDFIKKLSGGTDLSKSMKDLGKSSASNFTSGLSSNIKGINTTGKIAGTSFASGFSTSLDSASGSISKKSLEYGKNTSKIFQKMYFPDVDGKPFRQLAKEASSKAITQFGEKLYKDSDQYKEDEQNLKSYNKELDKLEKKRTKLQSQLNSNYQKSKTNSDGRIKSISKEIKTTDKAMKAAKKAGNESEVASLKAHKKNLKQQLDSVRSNKKASESRTKQLQNELKQNEKDIKEAKKKIKHHAVDVATHIKQVFTEYRNSLIDSFKSFMDPFSVDIDSGIGNLFEKKDDSASNLEESKKNLEEEEKNLELYKSKKEEIQGELASLYGRTDVEANLRRQDLQRQLDELDEQISNSQSNIDSLKSDVESAESERVSVTDMIQRGNDNLAKQRENKANIDSLKNRKLDGGLIAYLQSQGDEGMEMLATLATTASDDEIAQLNYIWGEYMNSQMENWNNGNNENMDKAAAWAAGFDMLRAMGYSEELIKQLQDQGIESGWDYMQMLLSADPKQVAEANANIAEGLKLPTKYADQIIASFAKAGSDGIDALVDSLNSVADADENGKGKNKKGAKKKKSLEKSGTKIGETVGEALKKETGKKGRKAALELIRGLAAGLGDEKEIKKGSDQAKKLAKAIYKAAADVLGIKSPSKEFAKIGRFVDEGFILGLASKEKDVADSALDVMQSSLAAVSGIAGTNMNVRPTVSPVMDLTNVQNGFNTIGRLDGYRLDGSLNLAMSAAGNVNLYLDSDALLVSAIGDLNDALRRLEDRQVIEQHNEFNIQGSNPKEIANEVSHIINQQVERRKAVWR